MGQSARWFVASVVLVGAACCSKNAARSTTPDARAQGVEVAAQPVNVSTFWDDVATVCRELDALTDDQRKTPAVAELALLCADKPVPFAADPQARAGKLGELREEVRKLAVGALTDDEILKQLVGAVDVDVSDDLTKCAESIGTLTTAKLQSCADKIDAKLTTRLRDAGARAIDASKELAATPSPVGGGTIAGVAGVPGLDGMVDHALRGLSQFLVKRAHAEVRVYAIDRIRTIADCGATSIRGRLFSNACAFLGAVDGGFSPSFGSGLRAAFARDIAALPQRILAEIPREGLKRELLFRAALEAAVVYVDEPDPAQIAAAIKALTASTGGFTCTGDPELVAECATLKARMHLAARVVVALAEDGGGGDRSASYYLLLLKNHARAWKTTNCADTTATSALELCTLLGHLETLEETKAELLVKVEAARAAFFAARAALRSLRTLPADEAGLTAEEREVRRERRRRDAMVRAARHAAVAVAAADELVGELVCEPNGPATCRRAVRLPGELVDLIEAVADRDFGAMFSAGVALAIDAIPAEHRVQLSPEALRVLQFGADLAMARNADDAETAIEAIAAPLGSFREKQRRRMMSITGLVGFAVGHENILGLVDQPDPINAVSPVVAVGIDLTTPIGTWGALGILLPIVDLGSLASFSVDGDQAMDVPETDETPPVGLAQVLSPGAYLRWNVRSSPFSVGAGGVFVPKGRTVDAGEGDEDRTVLRVNVFLAVDVTLLGF